MKIAELKNIRTQASRWPTFEKSWDDLPTGARSLVVDRMLVKSLDPLSRFTKLQNLFVHSLRDRDIQQIAGVAGLRRLLVWKLDAKSIHELGKLKTWSHSGYTMLPNLVRSRGLRASP